MLVAGRAKRGTYAYFLVVYPKRAAAGGVRCPLPRLYIGLMVQTSPHEKKLNYPLALLHRIVYNTHIFKPHRSKT